MMKSSDDSNLIHIKIGLITFLGSVCSEAIKSLIPSDKILAASLGIFIGGVIGYLLPPKIKVEPAKIIAILFAASALYFLVRKMLLYF